MGAQIWMHYVGIQAQGVFKTKDTLLSESVYMRGAGGLCSISYKRVDMEKMSYLGYATPV